MFSSPKHNVLWILFFKKAPSVKSLEIPQAGGQPKFTAFFLGPCTSEAAPIQLTKPQAFAAVLVHLFLNIFSTMPQTKKDLCLSAVSF